jgi:hypothetical protein
MTIARKDDRGVAMITVVMLGAALLLVMSLVFTRGLAQFDNTSGDALWEQALAAAESGLNQGLATLETDGGYSTGETLPDGIMGSDAEKGWVLTAASAHPPEDVGRTTDGEFVVIRPSNAPVVYAVGYAPARTSDEVRTRVVRTLFETEAETTQWTTRLAFLSGGDLTFRGNPTFLTGAAVGIHTNQFLDVGGSTYTDGCVSASGGSKVTGSFVQPPGCDPPGGQPTIDPPMVDPRGHWSESQYDLCPDGKVRAGPAHPVYGNTATSVPCSGQTLTADASTNPYLGWSYLGCCDSNDWASWKYGSTAANDGVFYVYQGVAKVVSSPGADLLPWEVTIYAEGRGVCTAIQGGDIVVAGSPDMTPYDPDNNLQLVAGRDLDISGNADFTGLAAAHEQIEITGDLDVHDGSFLAESACDSTTSHVHESYVGGGATIHNHGPIATGLSAPQYVLVARSWVEL